MLPSFLYLPHPDELRPEDRVLPWGEPSPLVIGELARSMGGRTPIRLVASAKSWLCHPGVDRRAAILPVEAPEEVARVSPLEASTRYLAHLCAAWDQQPVSYTHLDVYKRQGFGCTGHTSQFPIHTEVVL